MESKCESVLLESDSDDNSIFITKEVSEKNVSNAHADKGLD